MTRQKLKLTDQERRARLLRLKQLGIAIGPDGDPSPEPDRFMLEPINKGFARLFVLPARAVTVVVPVRMTVLTSGTLITDAVMTTAFDDFPLELADPKESDSYEDVMNCLQPFSPKVLNHLLTSGVPLRCRKVDGVILANGWSEVPPQYPDWTFVKGELLLFDETRNRICVEFEVQVDRSLMLRWERRRQQQPERARFSKGTGLFGPNRGQPIDQKSVSPKKPSISSKLAEQRVTQETRKPN